MNTDKLVKDLAVMGHHAQVEERGRVAVIVMEKMPADAAARRRIVSLARVHGYSNACVELAPPDANLPGD